MATGYRPNGSATPALNNQLDQVTFSFSQIHQFG
jgi:hypothetical protein